MTWPKSWPKQKNAAAFYGNPCGQNGLVSQKWMTENLVAVRPPFLFYFVDQPVSSVRIHRRCGPSLERVLNAIWLSSGESQAKLDEWGVSALGGTFNFRRKRNGSSLSMHAYGCAIDLAPQKYPMGLSGGQFCEPVLKAFADEGWMNLPNDRMHFQAAVL